MLLQLNGAPAAPSLTLSALCLALAAFSQTALASESDPPEFNKWHCFAASQENADAYTVSRDKFRINNLNIREATDFITGAPLVEISASASNRSAAIMALSVEVIGLGQAKPIFAISTMPPFNAVGPGDNAELKGKAIAERGSLAGIDTVCVRAGTHAFKR